MKLTYTSRLLAVLFISLLLSCGGGDGASEPNSEVEQEQVPVKNGPEYLGGYYEIQADSEGKYKIVMDCKSDEPVPIEIGGFAGSPGTNYISFDKEGLRMCEFSEFNEEEGVLTFVGDCYVEGDFPGNRLMKMRSLGDDKFELEVERDRKYVLIDAKSSEGYAKGECVKLVVSKEEFEKEILNAFNMIHRNDLELGRYNDGGVIVKTPGPGLHPYIDTVYGKFEDSMYEEFFAKQGFQEGIAEIELYKEGKQSFVTNIESIIDVCQPDDVRLYIMYEGLETKEGKAIAILTYMDGEEIYTFCIITFTYTDQIWIKEIDLTDCSA